MKKESLIIVFVIAQVFSMYSEALEDFNFKKAHQDISIPAPSFQTKNTLKASYEEYLSALNYYSEVAYNSDPSSDRYIEAFLAGNYLRRKIESIKNKLNQNKSIEIEYDILNNTKTNDEQKLSPTILRELNEVFGFESKITKTVSTKQPVIIKDKFCKIVYVKGNIPFLVQEDSFLKEGEVILTFDDGPGKYSQEIAQNLNQHSARAIFFVLGYILNESGQKIIATVHKNNHHISVHGYYHATQQGKPFTAYPLDTIINHLKHTSTIIESSTGEKPLFFRPPYGIIQEEAINKIISEMKLIPVGWTIDSMDWSIKSSDELYNRLISLIKNRKKGIILLHDIHPQTYQIHDRLVKWLKENNYKIVSPQKLQSAFMSN